MILALDTESTYAKGRDIRSLGIQNYLRHPDTHHYLVSLYGDGFAWVGEPERAPWDKLAGATLLSHNAQYDQSVLAELRRRGVSIPEPSAWHCTADLAAYCQSPRALDNACRELLGLELDKSTRDFMKNKTWGELFAEEKLRVAEYALLDAKACFELWRQGGAFWQPEEVQASDHTALMCRRGIGVNLDRVQAGLATLEREMWEATNRIPWAHEQDAKGKEIAITSPKAIRAECVKRGIEPPETTEAKSEEFAAWLEVNEGKADFVQAVQRWRQANRLAAVLETMRDRTVEGRLHYGLKYFGATHTGRWSGDSGLNLQNLPRKPFAGVDARACLVPADGKRFVVADFAQIEARVTVWLAGDEATLAMLRQGVDIYEAHARRTMGYTDPRPLSEVDKDLRQFAKCRVLALGFGLGGNKFQSIVKLWTGKDITSAQAQDMVSSFRRTNPGVIGLWKRLETALRNSRGGDFHLELPSGRQITYFQVAERSGKLSGRVERGDYPKNLYGGLLTENLVQASARDLFARAVVRLEKAGLPVVLHVHDEVVCEVDEADAEEAEREVQNIMRDVPEWAEGLPVECSTEIKAEYGK